MLPPKYLSATKPKKSWAPDVHELDSDLTKEPDATVREGATDPEFFHQRFRNFLYVEFVGPRKTLFKLRNLCLDWLQPETRTKEEIIELLVLEQYLTILPEKIKPWVRAKKPENCEKLVTLLENYKEMYEPGDDNNSDLRSEDSMSRKGAESPPPRSASSFCSDRDRDWDQEWDRERDRDWDLDWDRDRERRGRSRDLGSRDRWPYPRNPRGRLPQRDLSLPLMEKTTFATERERKRRDSVMDYESRSQDAVSYQDVVNLTEDRKPQNPIQDNMENYRKLLSLGVQLAEDDGHSHMTQGHSSRSKRSAYPSTSRGLKSMPETKKSTHRRGICEDESSHGVIMEKFIKDVSRNSKSGRARESNDRSQRFPRRPDNDWKEASFNKRESVIQERGYEGNGFGGGFNFNSSLVSKKRVLERKRRYQFDTDGKGSAHEQKGYARKRPFECSEMRKAMSMSSLSAPSFTESQPLDFGAMPYVCDECGRSFSVISEFVEHQIMHTRENLYEYGESFIHSVAVSEVQKSQAGGKRFECKECGETFNKSAALAEHRKIHAREHLAECNDEEYEEPFMPSPTFSELQKIYGKDKFYECKVCKETFLHSSALIDHQKIHGRDDKDNERGEGFKPSPPPSDLPKTYGKEKMYECKVCGETFHHSSSLKEHQKIHTRGNLFESKGKVCEETFIPGQSLKRRQKTYPKEKLYDFTDGGDAFRQSSDLSEHQKIHSRKNLFEGRGYEKSVIHSVPFTESQKSHTITRPPEDDEDQKAFTVSSNPDDNQKVPPQENVYERKPYERSVIHSLAFAKAEKSHSAVGPSKPKVIAESPIQSSGVTEHQKAHAGENTSEGKKYERSVIHSVAAFKPPKSCNGNEVVECEEKGESSTSVSDRHDKQQKTPARENPNEGGKNNNYKDSVIQSVSHMESQKSPTSQGSSELKKDGESSTPTSNVREHQKARSKKKNIERRNYETSVIHSLRFGDHQTFRPREKFYECPECGESFVRSYDLTEHLKIHDRKKPSGSKNYERSVIRSLVSTDPQTSYAEQQPQTSYAGHSSQMRYSDQAAQTSYAKHPVQASYSGMHMSYAVQPAHMSYTQQAAQTSYMVQPTQISYDEEQAQTSYAEQQVRNRCRECGECFATIGDLGAHQKIYAREEFHGRKLFGDTVIQGIGLEGPRPEEPRQNEPDEQDEQDEPEDAIYGCKDCGLGFADRADLKDHQKVHGREYLIDSREYTHSVIHTHSVSEYQKDYIGEQLYECPACGESFVHSSFLFEHQKIHEQDQFYGQRRYDEPFVQPLVINPRRPRAPQKNPTAGTSLQCHVCGQDFIHGSVLGEHMRIHTREDLPEQGQRSEDAVSPGLALTEFQRSQTEEKHYECKTCGETFLNQSDLREHMRIHEKDEPYDYGASFVHTSFLTEPPKRDSPFYECKDCGKSFIHNTVLTKHQKLHLEEEEEEGAQEVEANVLVPREVLRIQGSNVEAAEPEVEAAEPEVEAAEPNVEAAEPNGEAEGPDGEAAEPDGEAEQPNGEAEQPNGDADEPDGAGIEDPEERAEEPEGDADEPDGAGIEDPEEEGEDQEIQVEEPYYDCRECGETFASNSAYGEHLKTHARVIIFEPGNVYGESSRYTEHASTSTSDNDRADDKYFKCDVCGQLFSDRLSLARHQNTHTG
ncbi:paternally-expressed gene 3 protein [Panthera pardus]|uniref:Paternally-expressed gene 3 protein n=2 Tax=Felidae TaxID=9681 RepID=A0A9V1EZX8_PANPR|nr:paternally-expressed gene 3 protein [Panthera pardus]XP_019292445.1 paternally-expressed gene 3 protein [Panthera pardus]XP_019292446.1 paternally-expressed gene 3 protein [Panthera pardus]XP_053762162.1 paternally-expressed gene 3 protein [Panthera pardus]XP_053762163.1 paternally-expressed gene 3 protein [Panthera pardus]XP_060508255.1 paternally-expressed gene 3 protein [Panthera onca]XP_060508256.1 paternally-expressed gene 3 protein [Panthera onca]XP_060508257.1 paternally-expressed 